MILPETDVQIRDRLLEELGLDEEGNRLDKSRGDDGNATPSDSSLGPIIGGAIAGTLIIVLIGFALFFKPSPKPEDVVTTFDNPQYEASRTESADAEDMVGWQAGLKSNALDNAAVDFFSPGEEASNPNGRTAKAPHFRMKMVAELVQEDSNTPADYVSVFADNEEV
jgi:hypothetical protein